MSFRVVGRRLGAYLFLSLIVHVSTVFEEEAAAIPRLKLI